MFSTYVPDAKESKSALKENLWARTQLEFKANCDKSIKEAQISLDGLKDTYKGSLKFNKTVYLIAISFFGFHFVYMILNTICYAKIKCR